MRRVEDAVLAGLLVPRLSGHAVAVLANLGTQASQQALVDVASRFVNPLAGSPGRRQRIRLQRAALRPAAWIKRRFAHQYARYNESASQDPATQKVLASILNTIESRATPSILEAAKKGAAPEKPGPSRRAKPVSKA